MFVKIRVIILILTAFSGVFNLEMSLGPAGVATQLALVVVVLPIGAADR